MEGSKRSNLPNPKVFVNLYGHLNLFLVCRYCLEGFLLRQHTFVHHNCLYIYLLLCISIMMKIMYNAHTIMIIVKHFYNILIM